MKKINKIFSNFILYYSLLLLLFIRLRELRLIIIFIINIFLSYSPLFKKILFDLANQLCLNKRMSVKM